MKKSLGKADFYNHYIEAIESEIKDKKRKIFEFRSSKDNLVQMIEDRKFEDAYITIENYEPVEYMAYFFRAKDMRRTFKLEDCVILTGNNVEHEHNTYLKGVIYNIIKYNNLIKKFEESIEELEHYVIPYNKYKAIIDVHDNLLVKFLLDGKRYLFIEVQFNSDGAADPILNDVSVSFSCTCPGALISGLFLLGVGT